MKQKKGFLRQKIKCEKLPGGLRQLNVISSGSLPDYLNTYYFTFHINLNKLKHLFKKQFYTNRLIFTKAPEENQII